MSPELYFAVMLITNPQKAKRILTARDWDDWFMDLFDEEFEDILNGSFKDKQEEYIDKIVDKYLETTGVSMTATDEYSLAVIEKAVKTASEIQETTWKNIISPKTVNREDVTSQVADFIASGIAIGTALFATEELRKWLNSDRANLIALNEANWIWNNQEFFEAKGKNKKKTWHTALDEKVRFSHMAMEGVTIGIDEYFHVGSSLMLYPLDVSGGASADEIVNCRCSVEYSK